MLNLVVRGDVVVGVNGSLVGQTPLKDVWHAMKPVMGSTVDITFAADPSMTFERNIVTLCYQRVPVVSSQSLTHTNNFFYGGSQQDSDKCIGQLMSNREAYLITPDKNTLSHIFNVYAKHKGRKSLVVISYEETKNSPSHTERKTKSVNEEKQKAAHDVTRALAVSTFWNNKQVTVLFEKPTHMFVFCDKQPYDRGVWEGWTFHHVSDQLV